VKKKEGKGGREGCTLNGTLLTCLTDLFGLINNF
jgi:hypothetical protein